MELLEKYEVAYIVAGDLERAYYRDRGIDKFDAMVSEGILALEYSNPGTRIYGVIER